jgi:arylsulfatase A-like enzyme
VGGKKTPTRKDFLKTVGAGAAGMALLGTPACDLTDRLLKPSHNRPKANQDKNAILVILDSLRRDHVGAYGNDRIKTPNLDALAGESLRFTKAHPDAMPTLPARRAIHTGMRTFPVKPPTYGWRSIPEGQATLAEILKAKGYSTFLVTDTYHQWKPSMNFGRGFDVFRKIRGQQGDPYKDPSVISEEEMRQRYLVLGKGTNLRQHLANTRGRKTEEDWFAPKVFINAMGLLEEARRSERFFIVVDCYDPHEVWDPPEEYIRLYDPDSYEGKEPLYAIYGADDYLTER